LAKKQKARAVERQIHPAEIVPNEVSRVDLPDCVEPTITDRLRTFLRRLTQAQRRAALANPTINDWDRYVLSLIDQAIDGGNDRLACELWCRLDGRPATAAISVVREEWTLQNTRDSFDKDLIAAQQAEIAELREALEKQEELTP
jgi:hypothetical protein